VTATGGEVLFGGTVIVEDHVTGEVNGAVYTMTVAFFVGEMF
jgi:hypothetical protein